MKTFNEVLENPVVNGIMLIAGLGIILTGIWFDGLLEKYIGTGLVICLIVGAFASEHLTKILKKRIELDEQIIGLNEQIITGGDPELIESAKQFYNELKEETK
ncbi:hypothetical protein [Flavobacterium filum]|uniref:hypothetical protein n=1 Tax=Flavobacterium filum TaxID=370974 RepID=UPI0023F5150A|nr:hypothetical protein [Flavobacterium filum]